MNRFDSSSGGPLSAHEGESRNINVRLGVSLLLPDASKLSKRAYRITSNLVPAEKQLILRIFRTKLEFRGIREF